MKLSRLFLPHFARGLIRAASVLGFAAALGLSQSANAGAFLFRKIADNSTAVPGGSGTFQTLGGAILSQGNAAFGATDMNGKGGVYLYSGGRISPMIRDGDRITPGNPNSPTIDVIGGFDLSGTNLAFYATTKTPGGFDGEGVYRRDESGISLVKAGLHVLFAIDGPSVAAVSLDNVNGTLKETLTVTAGGITQTAGPTVPYPSGYGTGLAIQGQKVTYSFTNGAESAIVVGGVGGGVQIVTKNTPLPGFSGAVAAVDGIAASGSDVAFFAISKAVDQFGFPKNDAIYLYQNGTLKKIADTTTKIPGTTEEFTQFSQLGVSNGKLAFGGDNMKLGEGFQPPTVSGIYYHDGRKLSRVVAPGSKVDGKIVADPRDIGAGFNTAEFGDFEDDVIVMSLVFTDGSYGIYAATPGPDTDSFTVNSIGDAPDNSVGDGSPTTGGLTADNQPEVTLRSAMMEANAKNNRNTITFKLPGAGPYVIAPTSPLPQMVNPVTIDATSQPGYGGTPIVQINGASAGAGANGIEFTGGKSTLRGVVLEQFGGSGIVLSDRGKNTVENCYAGTDVSGVNARPNGTGILVSSDDNVIGGVTDAARNVISGNTGDGIKIMSGKHNRVMGNFIGTDSDGAQPLANRAGIRLANRDSTRIGGIVPGAGNVISGNTAAGIVATADDGEVTTRVEGNRIGTTTSGMGAAANGEGILIENLGGMLIGGRKPEARNVISGNTGNGVQISGATASRTVVQGNYIGLRGDGAAALGNGDAGVRIVGGTKNLIGSPQENAGNFISGNEKSGIHISGGSARRNFIQGNIVGLDATGANAVPNKAHGVFIEEAPRTLIGGDMNGALNVVSGNREHGIFIRGDGAEKTVVARNLIGTDRTGVVSRGNDAGVLIEDAHDILIGGPREKSGSVGNIIAGNVTGIRISTTNPLAGAHNNTIQDNDIGVGLLGAPLPNAVGINVGNQTGRTLIGGAAAGSGNTIAFNTVTGVEIFSSALLNTTTVTLLRNSIYASGMGRGIDYFGDLNPNAPTLTGFTVPDAGKGVLTGTLISRPGAKFRIEIFANTVGDPSGFGEGELYVGRFERSTDASGLLEFRIAVPRELRNFTATSTAFRDSAFADTSDFSNVLAGPAPAPPLVRRAGDARTVRYVEADGDAVTVRSGRDGFVSLDGNSLTLTPRDPRASLAISVQRGAVGDGRANVGSLVVHGDLRRLNAPAVNFLGIHVDGVLGRLVIGDLLAGARLTAGGAPTDRTRITARAIGKGASIQLGSALDRLTADSVRDAEISAPRVGELRIRDGFETVTISDPMPHE